MSSGLQKRRFLVALSFPGERRAYVGEVATALASSLGKERVFYDMFYEAELARPNLDLYLGEIYREQSDLVVPFFCSDFERKKWCQLEWRQMREVIFNLESDRIMRFRFDGTPIRGLLSTDGYTEIGVRAPAETAALIIQRVGPSGMHPTLLDKFPDLTKRDFLVLNKACELLSKRDDPEDIQTDCNSARFIFTTLFRSPPPPRTGRAGDHRAIRERDSAPLLESTDCLDSGQAFFEPVRRCAKQRATSIRPAQFLDLFWPATHLRDASTAPITGTAVATSDIFICHTVCARVFIAESMTPLPTPVTVIAQA